MLSARQLPLLAGAGLLLAALACLTVMAGQRSAALEALEVIERGAPSRMSSLMWIASPNNNRPLDFLDFRSNCLAACSAAQLDQSRCYKQVRPAGGEVVAEGRGGVGVAQLRVFLGPGWQWLDAGCIARARGVQGYLAHKKPPHPSTLQ